MEIIKFAQEVHRNAVDHGWWEGERTLMEIVALIHSEWSEALEEYRAGRGMLWYHCEECEPNGLPCEPRDEYDCLNHSIKETCPHRGKKPEGIAVELIDGCIRILDYIGKERIFIRELDTLERLMDSAPEATYKLALPHLIANLHLKTSQSYQLLKEAKGDEMMLRRGNALMFEAMAVACCWIREQNCSPEQIMQTKHEYNRTRPYKHGGKVC